MPQRWEEIVASACVAPGVPPDAFLPPWLLTPSLYNLQATEESLVQKASGGNGNSTKLLKEEVTESDIAEIISKWTGEHCVAPALAHPALGLVHREWDGRTVAGHVAATSCACRAATAAVVRLASQLICLGCSQHLPLQPFTGGREV
eukprot:351965-Chlamydomonas_euryale.AAC.9